MVTKLDNGVLSHSIEEKRKNGGKGKRIFTDANAKKKCLEKINSEGKERNCDIPNKGKKGKPVTRNRKNG